MLPKVKELPRPTFPLVGLFLFTALPFYRGTDHCPRWHRSGGSRFATGSVAEKEVAASMVGGASRQLLEGRPYSHHWRPHTVTREERKGFEIAITIRGGRRAGRALPTSGSGIFCS
jgi:hypothetical protein